MLEKLCSYHKVLHPVAEFGKLARSPDGLQPICKVKRQEIIREYRKRTGYKPSRTPEQRMAHNLMKNYKITLKQYNEMLMGQCGLCAVCGNES